MIVHAVPSSVIAWGLGIRDTMSLDDNLFFTELYQSTLFQSPLALCKAGTLHKVDARRRAVLLCARSANAQGFVDSEAFPLNIPQDALQQNKILRV